MRDQAINASFQTELPKADQFEQQQNRGRESRSLDGRSANDFLDPSKLDFSSDREAWISIIKGGTRPRSTLRTDRAGTVISRHTKNYKVSFADNITNDKEKIADVFLVESFKRYNLENTHGGG